MTNIPQGNKGVLGPVNSTPQFTVHFETFQTNINQN